MKSRLGKEYVEQNYKDSDFLGSHASSLYLKKEFRVDPKTKQRVPSTYQDQSLVHNKKRSLTFNQLLAKFGYIEDESMTKKVRVRNWHIKKIKAEDSDSSSS